MPKAGGVIITLVGFVSETIKHEQGVAVRRVYSITKHGVGLSRDLFYRSNANYM